MLEGRRLNQKLPSAAMKVLPSRWSTSTSSAWKSARTRSTAPALSSISELISPEDT